MTRNTRPIGRLTLTRGRAGSPRIRLDGRRVPGNLVLVTGGAGSGKTTVLRDLYAAATRAGVPTEVLPVEHPDEFADIPSTALVSQGWREDTRLALIDDFFCALEPRVWAREQDLMSLQLTKNIRHRHGVTVVVATNFNPWHRGPFENELGEPESVILTGHMRSYIGLGYEDEEYAYADASQREVLRFARRAAEYR